MSWYRARWINTAWLDTLLKRLLTLAIALVVAVVVIFIVSAVMGDGGATETSYGVRKGALRIALIFLVWIGFEVVRLIIQPIRAAVSGTFLDEYAARRQERAHAAQARMPTAKRIAPGSTAIFKGQDPAAAGMALGVRVANVAGFYNEAKRWPDPQAAPGSDEYFHAQTLAELNREVRHPEAPKSVQRDAKLLDFLDKEHGWRGHY